MLKRGYVGTHHTAGEVVLTNTGNETTPFPKLNFGSNRSAINSVKRVDKWLMDNAVLEARRRKDGFNEAIFAACTNKPSQADKDCAELYLFWSEDGTHTI